MEASPKIIIIDAEKRAKIYEILGIIQEMENMGEIARSLTQNKTLQSLDLDMVLTFEKLLNTINVTHGRMLSAAGKVRRALENQVTCIQDCVYFKM